MLNCKVNSFQTIHLAQVLQKFIWSSSGQLSNILQEASALQQQQHHLGHQQNQQCCRPSDSVSSSEADGDSANNPGALALSAVASLSAVAKAAKEGVQQQQLNSDIKQGRTLLERSAVDAPECDFSIQDLEDLDDLNDYSEDDDEEEEEEDDDDDDDEELASSDEETAAIQQQQRQQQQQLARSRSKMAAAAASVSSLDPTPKGAAETARRKKSPVAGEDRGEEDETAKMSPGKRYCIL